jgi:UDP-N-acetylmuramoylalanine--D-glutamate ligase
MDQETYQRILAQRLTEQLMVARRQALAEQAVGPHSLELVGTHKGVEYINDSRSTFLDSTLAAIAGALASEVGRGHVQDFLKGKVVALVLFGRTSERAIEALQPFTEHVHFAEEVRTAVFLSGEIARPGEVVLFSPACPSGDGFANYEERGTEFKRAVRDL